MGEEELVVWMSSLTYALVPMMAVPQTARLLEVVNRRESSAF